MTVGERFPRESDTVRQIDKREWWRGGDEMTQFIHDHGSTETACFQR